MGNERIYRNSESSRAGINKATGYLLRHDRERFFGTYGNAKIAVNKGGDK